MWVSRALTMQSHPAPSSFVIIVKRNICHVHRKTERESENIYVIYNISWGTFYSFHKCVYWRKCKSVYSCVYLSHTVNEEKNEL